jgi:hypothetical protein
MPGHPYCHIIRHGKYTHGPGKNQHLFFEETVTFSVLGLLKNHTQHVVPPVRHGPNICRDAPQGLSAAAGRDRNSYYSYIKIRQSLRPDLRHPSFSSLAGGSQKRILRLGWHKSFPQSLLWFQRKTSIGPNPGRFHDAPVGIAARRRQLQNRSPVPSARDRRFSVPLAAPAELPAFAIFFANYLN